jgi:AraC-like DNA-binding protein
VNKLELYTQGSHFHPQMQLPIVYHPNVNLAKLPKISNRLQLILAYKGAGIGRVGDFRGIIITPTVFCLNAGENLELEKGEDFVGQSIIFHPSYINNGFTLENIHPRNDTFYEELSFSEQSDLALLKPFGDRGTNYHGFLNLRLTTANRLGSLFNALNLELNKQNDLFWPCRSRSFFLELINLVMRVFINPETTDVVPLPEEPKDIDGVILYLHTNYHQEITLSDLARIFHTNRTTLNAKFNQITGQSLLSYLIDLRIKVASLMLRDTTIPIEEVIERTGFHDRSYFNRMFKKHTGCSPGKYRTRYCWVLSS